MAYDKHVWQCGEAITTEKLNHMEDGIEEALECCGGGGEPFVKISFELDAETGDWRCVLLDVFSDEVITYYATWDQISSVLKSGKYLIASSDSFFHIIADIDIEQQAIYFITVEYSSNAITSIQYNTAYF